MAGPALDATGRAIRSYDGLDSHVTRQGRILRVLRGGRSRKGLPVTDARQSLTECTQKVMLPSELVAGH